MKAINCISLLPYSISDLGTGRCRMSKASMMLNRVFNLGTCAKLCMNVEGRSYVVLCTVWPDTNDCLLDNMCCIDDSVSIGSRCSEWTESLCEVVDIWIPKILTSLCYKDESLNVRNSDLLGMAILPGCSINTKRHNSNQICSVVVSRMSSPGVGIVTTSTLLINESKRKTGDGLSIHDATLDKTNSFCNISVVNEIKLRVVMPYVCHDQGTAEVDGTATQPRLPTPPLVKGLLLVGPPGVGKTFAVKAVQCLCSPICKVRIFEVNIPMLLSSADPLSELNALFASIEVLRRSVRTDSECKDSGEATESHSAPGTPLSSKYASSSSTPTTVRGVSGTPATKQNTFTYRSPAAMAASATAAAASRSAEASSEASPSTACTPLRKASSTISRTTPARADSAFPFSKRGPSSAAAAAGKYTPQQPSSLKEMLAASTSASNGSARKDLSTAAVVSGTVEANTTDPIEECGRYFPEMAFIVVDEIDALGKTGLQNENKIVIKQYLCRWLDEQNAHSPTERKRAASVACCMVGTSNRSADIDVAFRRGGRLEHEIAVQNTQEDRANLLQRLLADKFTGVGVIISDDEGEAGLGVVSEVVGDCSQMISPAQLLSQQEVALLADKIAMQTGGYVAADLAALVSAIEKLLVSVNLNTPAESDTRIEEFIRCFHIAAKSVTPSCLRGAAISLPNLTFNDVIGNEEVKRSLLRVMSLAKPEKQEIAFRFGLNASPGGVLLYGPPGNSKTRMASAAAAHFGLPMISLSAADIYSPYVGDAEAEVRRAFQLARQAAPCVLFIDELDSIVTNRANDSSGRGSGGGGGGSSSASVEGRVLATLLTEMDGIQNTNSSISNSSEYSQTNNGKSSGKQNSTGGVIVLGATNRLDFIDAALIRKGRFHHVLHVAPPNASERQLLLQYFTAKCGLRDDTAAGARAIKELQVRLKDGMSGAEIENICKEAALALYSQQLSQ